MSDKTPAEKARIKPGTRIAVLNLAPALVDSLGLPPDISFVDPSDADLVFVAAQSKAELESQMVPVIEQLGLGAALWVFFRKGGASKGLDMNRDDVWAIAEEANLRPLGLTGIDDRWSAFRFRHAPSDT